MNLAIILLNWNGEKLLKKFLPTLVNHSSKSKIYIIDNGSTDGSIKYVRNNFKNISCILLDKNYGFSKGYNLGLKKIKADLYCLINTDVEVTENWIQPVLNRFKSDINVKIAQPKLLDLSLIHI